MYHISMIFIIHLLCSIIVIFDEGTSFPFLKQKNALLVDFWKGGMLVV